MVTFLNTIYTLVMLFNNDVGSDMSLISYFITITKGTAGVVLPVFGAVGTITVTGIAIKSLAGTADAVNNKRRIK